MKTNGSALIHGQTNFCCGFGSGAFLSNFKYLRDYKDLKRNRDIVRLRRDAIATDILLGHFDSTLERYQFKPSQIATPLISLLPKGEGDLGELWEMFTEFQSRQIEATTIYSTYRVVSRTIDRLPSRSLLDAPKIRNWLMENTSQFMASKYLLRFDQCCRWALEEESSQLIHLRASKKLRKPRITPMIVGLSPLNSEMRSSELLSLTIDAVITAIS